MKIEDKVPTYYDSGGNKWIEDRVEMHLQSNVKQWFAQIWEKIPTVMS